jgi:O-antigen ligase
VFWNYLALACVFWAVHDWLLGKTAGEDRAQRRTDSARGESRPELLPARLRGLLWVLCLNGALLGAEGIAQRLSGSGKLLWLIEPRVNKDGLSQFGPYAYRSNAAQYFNLLWPVCLGFWWTLHRTGGFKRWVHHLLLPAGAIMAACPIIATTRGGAMVAGGLIFLAAGFLLLGPVYLPARPRHSALTAVLTFGVLGIFFVTALTLGYQLGWDALAGRMTELESGYELREAMYVTARTMAQEHPWWGTGPGTFNQMFQFYRSSPDEYWPAQLHNDWLETRITFGGVGSALIASALLLVLARWFLAGGIHGGRRLVGLVWLALAGALMHARFDFPFQIYSIVLLFLVLCAVLFSLSRRGGD